MEQQIAFLRMIEDEFRELRDYITPLLNDHPNGPDYRVASAVHRALDLTTIITYGRIFKRNHGFETAKVELEPIVAAYTAEQRTLHEELLRARDQEYAHSDAGPNDITFYRDGPFMVSRRVIRMPLNHDQLRMLQNMVGVGLRVAIERRESLEKVFRAAT